jgi:hypothetical protein
LGERFEPKFNRISNFQRAASDPIHHSSIMSATATSSSNADPMAMDYSINSSPTESSPDLPSNPPLAEPNLKPHNETSSSPSDSISSAASAGISATQIQSIVNNPNIDREFSSALQLLQPLPSYLAQQMEKIRQFDEKAAELQTQLQQQHAAYLERLQSASDSNLTLTEADISTEESAIKALQRAILDHHKSKLLLASDSYELLDSNVRRLDLQLKKYEQKLRKGQFDVTAAPIDRRKGNNRNMIADPESKEIYYQLTEELKQDIDKQAGMMSSASNNRQNPLAPSNSVEPLYCNCRKVSYGAMVACDNEDCELEWFHFACVGLETKPRGKWYCEDCRKKMSKKGSAGKPKKITETSEEEMEI